MAHELDRRDNGVASIFSVRETPWHREGTVLSGAPSLEEALTLGGLDFTVETQPLYIRQGVPGLPEVGSYEKVPGAFATVRTDRQEVLGTVAGRYQPLQNRDAFGVLEPLLDAGLATLETGGALRGGRDVWVLVRFNIDSPVVQEVFADEVVPFGMISNNHAGQRKVVVQETPIRVVCANTLGAALKGRQKAIGVRHTASVEAKTVEAARELWRGLIERYGKLAVKYRVLKESYLDEALFRKLVLDVAAPIPAELEQKGLTGHQQGARRRIEARREKIRRLWTKGAGHTGDFSAWEAYNAVVETVDHDEKLWRTRGSRAESLLYGKLGDVKDEVLTSLLTY